MWHACGAELGRFPLIIGRDKYKKTLFFHKKKKAPEVRIRETKN